VARFLVTGGGGFIGSNLVEAILGRGDDARVLDDFSSGRRSNLEGSPRWSREGGGRLEIVEGDVRSLATCRKAAEGIDFVLHEAAIPSVEQSVRDPIATHAVNVTGTLHMLIAARDAGARRFVLASSTAVYGEGEELPKVESMAPDPISPYGAQKLACEIYCRLFHRLYRLPTIALRYFNVFGPRQDPESEYAAVVPRFLRAVRDGEPPTIFGDGEQTRDFVFVDDVVQANLKACVAGEHALGRAFNVASGERTSLNRLVATIAALARKPVAPVHAPARGGDIRHSSASIDRATADLGFRPAVDLSDGLARTWEALP
jgi:nucleoside-diphosphate-sugar epimerase